MATSTQNSQTFRSAAGIISTAIMAFSCTGEGFTHDEAALIKSSDTLMRVLTIKDSTDLKILRAQSSDLPASALMSDEYEKLCRLMISTVTHPSQDGVGIAGPQVGLNRRIIAVQRFDKEGFPFEVYPNIRIVWASDSLACGPEGCLSVPDMRGDVMRSTEIVIEYTDMEQLEGRRGRCPLPVIRDTVKGFTAVIFQHETDHLDGILYTDRL